MSIDEAIETRAWASAEDLQALKGPELVYAFNTLRLLITPQPKEVGKFADKTTAVKRVWALYEQLGTRQNAIAASDGYATAPEASAVPAEQETKTETETETPIHEEADMAAKKNVKKTKTPKTAGKGGRKSKFEGTQKITVVAETNPKRGAAKERFAIYRSGMLVSTFFEKGGRLLDLNWDVKHGFVTVD